MTIMTKENYVASNEPHTSSDQVVADKELHQIERTLNAHIVQLARVFFSVFQPRGHGEN